MAEAVDREARRLTWSGQAVDIGQIESELVRLRYQAAGIEAGRELFAIRTSLFNLIVYTSNRKAARDAMEVITGMAHHHPSRAIVVIAEPSDAESRIDADLAAHCHVNPGLEQQVCCEELSLQVSGRAASHLHGLVSPLLVPDLPVYIWWTGDLVEDLHAFQALYEGADRFIVDSARFGDARRQLTRLVGLCEEEGFCGLGDLNWSRLAPWRQVLWQQWQAADVRAGLERVTEIEIGISGDNRPPLSQVFLLLGWLSLRLGWEGQRLIQKTAGELALQSTQGEALIMVRHDSNFPDLEPGWLVSLMVSGQGRGGQASISIARAQTPLHLSVSIQDPETAIEGAVLIDECDEGDMLADELDVRGHDPEYEAALRRAMQFLDAPI